MKIDKNYLEDISGYTQHYFRIVLQVVIRFFFTIIAYILGRFKNIEIAPKCKFIGHTYFHRKPNPNIAIGNNCIFNSTTTSNLIGINRKCIISSRE